MTLIILTCPHCSTRGRGREWNVARGTINTLIGALIFYLRVHSQSQNCTVDCFYEYTQYTLYTHTSHFQKAQSSITHSKPGIQLVYLLECSYVSGRNVGRGSLSGAAIGLGPHSRGGSASPRSPSGSLSRAGVSPNVGGGGTGTGTGAQVGTAAAGPTGAAVGAAAHTAGSTLLTRTASSPTPIPTSLSRSFCMLNYIFSQ